MPGSYRWPHFLGILETSSMPPRALEVGSSQSLVPGRKGQQWEGLPWVGGVGRAGVQHGSQIKSFPLDSRDSSNTCTFLEADVGRTNFSLISVLIATN